jgi:hypothetical protein
MRRGRSGFVSDGWSRLRRNREYREQQAALAANIRAKYSAELSATTNSRQRVEIEKKIRAEIKRSKPSPYSLWSSCCSRS